MTHHRKSIGTFDYIVIGAGTAGCALASRLSEDPRTSVLLLEAGGKDDYHWIHVPVALASMLLTLAILASSAWRRKLDDITMLATTVTLALLGNAVICGVISGPHDRYGARMVWIATLTVLIAAIRHFTAENEAGDDSFAL